MTIDKTINHLKGETIMNLEEIFDGFDNTKQQMYEDYLVTQGVSQDVIAKSKDKVKHWDKKQWLAYKKEGDQIHADLVAAIKAGLTPASPAVQALIKHHYQMVTDFWTPTRESYIGLSQLYGSHPDFVKFYQDQHPQLLSFLQAAMKIYAEKELA